MRKILMIVGDFVEDYEAMVPYQSLLAFGMAVDCVCPGKKEGEVCRTAVHDLLGDQTILEKPGHNFALNTAFEDAVKDVGMYDALIIPGGRSPEYLALNADVITIVQTFSAAKKPIAAIAHGLLVLAGANVLEGKKCTGFPSLKLVAKAAGAEWIDADPISACIIDDKHNLVTAAGWAGHPEFLGLLLLGMQARVENYDKHVLVLCGDFMEDYEVAVPVQAMMALGYRVDTVCPDRKAGELCRTAVHDFEGDQTYTEKPGHLFKLSTDFDGVNVDDYDALVVPGGRAPEYLSLNARVCEIVRQFNDKSKPIASICHGQQILAAAGVLKGKKCTAYPAVKPTVVLAGGEWLDPEPISKCFVDGNLITGAAWPGHPEFVAKIMSALGTTVKV